MREMAKELRIHRPDLLVRDPLDQVVRFFGADPSSAGRNGYDAYVLSGRSPRNRIVDEDIVAINTTMGARSPHADWAKVIARGALRELRSVDPSWDLFLTSDKDWSRFAVPERIAALLRAVTGKGIGVSRATKVLHIKRPRLLPICDSYVLDLMGIPGEGVTRAVALIEHASHCAARSPSRAALASE